jgi:hypothetical protein
MKDYYYIVNEVLPQYNLDETMGDNALEFISQYDNQDTTVFLCKKLALFDHYLIKSQKGKPLLETFFEMMDVHPTTLVRDSETGKFYNKETGEEVKMAKSKDNKTPELTAIINKNFK